MSTIARSSMKGDTKSTVHVSNLQLVRDRGMGSIVSNHNIEHADGSNDGVLTCVGL